MFVYVIVEKEYHVPYETIVSLHSSLEKAEKKIEELPDPSDEYHIRIYKLE